MNRYYLQKLTIPAFLSERQIGQVPNAADRILKTFTDRENAYTYAAVQCQLDQLYGYWQVPAVQVLPFLLLLLERGENTGVGRHVMTLPIEKITKSPSL